MGVYQRGDSWYVSYYVKVDGKFKQIKKSCGCKKSDAVAYFGKMKAAQKENRLFDIKKEYTHSFNELLAKYKEAMGGQKSYRHKQYHFPLFEKAFAGRLLGDITPYDLEVFRNERIAAPVKSGVDKLKPGYKREAKNPLPPRKRKPASVNRELSTLRHMMSKAVEWDMIECSPFTKAKKLFYKENNQRLRFLTEIEESRLMKKCVGYLKDIVITALHSGMRKGEILSLRWAQIRNGFIYLTQTKADRARQIPINKDLKKVLDSQPRHITSDCVFHRADGTPYQDIIRSFKTAVRAAEIQDFTFHDLRHTFASRLVMMGVSLKVVQELLGHADIQMTMRYAHLAEKSIVDAVRLLEGKHETGAEDCSYFGLNKALNE